ncbi:hypothetical protein L208DRAFT_1336555 [Tricholoma matsutake]|nr:hypothetical protein L208DRAFT_1336555 [Tricholoma matsutake 945]
MYSFGTSTCYTYYESIQWCPLNPYHLIHCMCSIDHIIQYSVAYLCGRSHINNQCLNQLATNMPCPSATVVWW